MNTQPKHDVIDLQSRPAVEAMPAIRQEESRVLAAPASETTAIISMIERAARDPNVDIDKMERLLTMQERVVERRARQEYAEALAAMQAELPVIGKHGKNTNTKATYAKWEDVNEKIRPVLGRNGFSITFRTAVEPGAIHVTAVLTHRGGHSEETTLALPVDTGPGRNMVQAHGSTVTYGKRYAAAALLNLTSSDDITDDDGQTAGDGAPITEEHAMAIRERLEAVGADIRRFCDYLKVESIGAIPAARHDDALRALVAKERQARGGGR